MSSKPNHVAKDNVFRSLFSEPQYLLQLYQALHPDDTSVTEQDLQIVTMGQMFFNGSYNDLGFLVGDRLLILAEAQSTWSDNIMLRELMYLFGSYQEYLASRDIILYGTRPVSIPKPELYVVYTKERGDHPEWLSFSDIFFPDEECCIDARAKVLYVDYSKTIVDQYIRFCMVFDKQRKIHGNTEQAIMETIRTCRDENLLRDFLTRHEAEVSRMMGIMFSQEYVDRVKEKQIRADERRESKLSIAINMLKLKLHLADIAKATELSVDEVRELAKSNGLSVV